MKVSIAVYTYNRLRSHILKAKSYLGFTVALSGDGNTAMLGAPSFEQATHEGYVFVLARSGETWSEQQRLVPSGHHNGDEFGARLALSRDGGPALIGEFGGVVEGHFVFPASAWTLQP